MYKQRLYIFITLCFIAVCVCVARLAYFQIAEAEDYRRQIEQMRILDPTSLPTVRGTIYDRNGKALAIDRPAFFLHIDYQISRLMDDRFWQANTLLIMDRQEIPDYEKAELRLRDKFRDELAGLMDIFNNFDLLNVGSRKRLEEEIRRINDLIWRFREFIAWSRNFPESPLKQQYRRQGRFVPQSKALEEFRELVPDENERLKMTILVDIAEMHQPWPVAELKTDQQLLDAQLIFSDVDVVEIFPESKRIYPFDSAACQITGWAGPPNEAESALFEHDFYSRYLPGEVAGKRGAERVCEAILRGRRGEVVYDIEGNLISRKPAIFGQDVNLSIDIELQHLIEDYLTDPNGDPIGTGDPIGAVVLDVPTGDILAMASVPVFNLNNVREKYNEIIRDSAK